jgi:glycosyltransferase involved in cell wall biosynthesis
MKVLAFTKYGRAAASTRQRILQYIPALAAAGIEVEHRSLLDDDYVESLATGAGFSKAAVARSYARRLKDLVSHSSHDALWVYAELFPYFPSVFERLAGRSGKPIVYDFDDAFFHQYDDNPRGLVRTFLSGKLEPLLRAANICCCGNAYLQDYAARLCPRTTILPTVVDTEIYRPLPEPAQSVTPIIGWIGSPSTWPGVRPVLPVLREFARSGAARIRVVGAGRSAEEDRFPGLEIVDWSESTEVEEVRHMDVGIMPLLDLPFQRGKSGYKLVQYMACGLPVVATPVGVNREIVKDGVTGYLATSADEWRDALRKLLQDPQLRHNMGLRARERGVTDYSLATHAPRLVEIFRSL